MTQTAIDPAMLLSCETEKLNFSGAIQSFGACLCIDTVSGVITHTSANLEEFLCIDHSLLGRSIESCDWLDKKAVNQLEKPLGSSLIVAGIQVTNGPPPTVTNATLIRGNGSILIEFEKNLAAGSDAPFNHLLRKLLQVPDSEDDLRAAHQEILNAVDTIIGFDRLMIYRFHEDWSGEVIAERSQDRVNRYKGLRFPASDIPEIARKLYLLNHSRLIADATSQAVPIRSMEGSAPDLTYSDLRSVSPMHLAYMANMGVIASFSVPIRVAGGLWGLVACHHFSPRHLNSAQRKDCATLVRSYSLGLTSHLASRRVQLIDGIERKVDKVLEALAQHTDPLDGIEANREMLMELMSAQGFAMAINDDVVISGSGPEIQDMAILDGWFLTENTKPLVYTDHLASLLNDRELIEHEQTGISGMLAIKTKSRDAGWIRLYWFRPAETQEVLWAGKPEKPLVEKDGVLSLSPRKSFDTWTEIKTGHSRPWSAEDSMIATRFRSALTRWL
jgi:chemotaxis family two-component system sensor kinase Cph1